MSAASWACAAAAASRPAEAPVVGRGRHGVLTVREIVMVGEKGIVMMMGEKNSDSAAAGV